MTRLWSPAVQVPTAPVAPIDSRTINVRPWPWPSPWPWPCWPPSPRREAEPAAATAALPAGERIQEEVADPSDPRRVL